MPSSTFSFASSRFWPTPFSMFYSQWSVNLVYYYCQVSLIKAHVFALNVGMEAIVYNYAAILVIVLWRSRFQLCFATFAVDLSIAVNR